MGRRAVSSGKQGKGGFVSAATLCELDALLSDTTTACNRPDDFVLERVNTLLADGEGGVWILPVENGLDVRLCTPGREAVPLHKILTVLWHAGLSPLRGREAPWDVASHTYHVQSVVCALPPAMKGSLDEDMIAELELALSRDLAGEGDADVFNQLILTASLTLQEVWLVRAWAAYLQQLAPVFSLSFVRQILLADPRAVLGLVMLFKARLQPDWAGEGPKDSRDAAERMALKLVDATIATSLSAPVEAVWVALKQIVLSTLRTNYWSLPGLDEALAFKVNAELCDALGPVRPWRDIFVHHPTVEGVHLRGGPIARGGLRHSDRSTDYRTEVLGLMLTQMRKNTVVVPVGAKGGFFVRKGEVLPAYQRYVRALLSLTDTRVGKKVVSPRNVRVLDAPDPYFVVAADKGTAKFSDVANAEALAADYWGVKGGFWLGDAFASGGSKGYDHKGMGITAKGAWVSVLHHAGMLGLTPTSKRPLSVVGIGDMGGDVFGNGLLRSPHVKLVAAFNHRHIFLDPDPSPAVSFAERQRCFDAGLGWDAYDAKKISAGGGVWERSAKSIVLSDAVQKVLGIRVKALAPEALIQAILCAPVDVLWNGGIGTYIKASDEPHSAAADKANEPLRVNARDVRVRIIGEGGNLGITPRGRVELGRKGVRLNTDALDNSAGVDTSDHEVNLKILLRGVMEAGKLTEAARVKHIRAVTADMEEAVLTNNRLQNMAITLAETAPRQTQLEMAHWQQELEERGVVHPLVDFLPDHAVLEARALEKDKPLYTRPELCALLAGTKATLRLQLMAPEAADIVRSSAVAGLLEGYFPPATVKAFGPFVKDHPLADALVATALANLLINRLGMMMGPQLRGDFHAVPLDVVRACIVAMRVLDLPSLWDMVDRAGLDTAAEARVLMRLREVAAPVAAWVLRHGQPVTMGAWMGRLEKGSAEATRLLAEVLTPQGKADCAQWQAEWKKMGCPPALAARLAQLSPLVVAPDAILLAETTRKPLAKALGLHLAIGEALQLRALVRKVRALPVDDVWTRQALQAMVQELFARQRALTQSMLTGKSRATDVPSLPLGRYNGLVGDVLASPAPSLAMLSVLVGRLRELEA